MFTPEDRERLREKLLTIARADARITGGAITGSASVGNADRWSDIDLAFGLRDGVTREEVLADFTRFMYDEEGCVDHLDVPSNAWIYRVFLLRSTLQVDVAVAPAPSFGARQPTFRLVFGESAQLPHVTPPVAHDLLGYAWLYGLHVRSSIKRGRLWQAEHMLSQMRDYVLAHACLRLGLPAREARGVDRLAPEITRPLEESLVGRIDATVLSHAFAVVTEALLREARYADAALAARVEPVVREVAG